MVSISKIKKILYIEITSSQRGLGQHLSQDDYDKAVSEKEIFSDWMSTGLMSASSRRLLIFPADGDVPTYRDQYFG